MKKTLSTTAVAKLLGVAVGSVANWIDQGKLKAGRTPGGHRRVRREDLLDFIQRQKLPIPRELLPDGPRILVVDDEPTVTHWIVQAIRKDLPDCDVHEAHDGVAAGQIVGSLRPHVVLLDLRMPGLDGYEVCRRIKSNPHTADVVVLAMTAFPSPESEQRILACGARLCLNKPLSRETLLAEIRRCLPQIT